MRQDLELLISKRAKADGVSEDAVVQDILQARLLSGMFANSAHRQLVLKGGLAFRTTAKSHRYTKDVDLQTGPEIPMQRITSLMGAAIRESRVGEILDNVVITAPKQTETVQRWKINGDLPNGSHIALTVEISRRGMPAEEHLSKVEYRPGNGQPAVMVETYSLAALAAAKTAAFASPGRNAIRDIYDIDVLLRSEVTPSKEMIAAMGPDAIATGLQDLWAKLETMDYDTARRQLLPSLPRRLGEKIGEAEWDAMRLRVGTAVEGWLKEAEVAGHQMVEPERGIAP